MAWRKLRAGRKPIAPRSRARSPPSPACRSRSRPSPPTVASFVIGPVTDEIVTTQQAVADRFHRLGLIPKPIAVRDIVWRHTQS